MNFQGQAIKYRGDDEDYYSRPTPVIISDTAYCVGWGTQPHKTAQGFSPAERQAIRSRSAIVIISGARPAGGRTGTTYRVAIPGRDGKIYQRVPSMELLGALPLEAQAVR